MWLELQIFGFRALWSPYFLLFIISLAVLYHLITGTFRKKFGDNEKPTTKQHVNFYVGLILLYAVKGSPVDLLSHIMLSAHMIQMAVFYFIFPIFIYKGVPVWIWEKVVNTKWVKPIFSLLSKPLIALLLFNGLFSIYHIPVVFDFSKTSQLAHSSISIVLIVLAFIMWWPIMAPIKRLDTLNPLLKIGYLVASAAIITIACALLIFASNPAYSAYTSEGAWLQALSLCVPGDVLSGLQTTLSGPEMFSPLSILDDQQLGGIIMKFIQEIVYGILIGRIFFRWFSRKNMEVDPIPAALQNH
ncbi:cytochrome c oxidase assembly factor CtaG [Virgibacillus sp. W0181]|uniref:cytochrome c oxidase assembly factor CtaG n=1 Tax=Virgibacillus sp. W0181 TaxID=3391581 RepID=UPI003F46F6C0